MPYLSRRADKGKDISKTAQKMSFTSLLLPLDQTEESNMLDGCMIQNVFPFQAQTKARIPHCRLEETQLQTLQCLTSNC